MKKLTDKERRRVAQAIADLEWPILPVKGNTRAARSIRRDLNRIAFNRAYRREAQ